MIGPCLTWTTEAKNALFAATSLLTRLLVELSIVPSTLALMTPRGRTMRRARAEQN